MSARDKVVRGDVRVAKATAPAGRTWAVRAIGLASELADQPPLVALCAATLGAGLWRRDPRLARTGARMLAAEALATALKGVVKANVDRTRPYVVVAGGPQVWRRGARDESAWTSFPSGHTAGAVAVARAVTHDYPQLLGPAVAAAVTVATIQLPRGKHYPSDVLAGAAIGVAAELLVTRAERWLARALS